MSKPIESLTTAELTAEYEAAHAVFWAVRRTRPIANISQDEMKASRARYQRAVVERDRRAWNRLTREQRAEKTVASAYGWHTEVPGGTPAWFQNYLDGVMGAVEACESGGIDLGPRPA